MLIPGKTEDDGKLLDVSVLDTIFGCGSFRATVLKKINEGIGLCELATMYGFTENFIADKYFKAYVRYNEYQMYKDSKTSVRYLKAVRKLNKKTANALLQAKIQDMENFRNKVICGNALQFFGEDGLANILSVCKSLNIPVSVAKSVNTEEEEQWEQPEEPKKESHLEKTIRELINTYGAEAVAKASEEILRI